MDLILLIFLAWHIGTKARENGLNVFQWRLRLVLTWIGFEIAGYVLAIMLFGFDASKSNMFGLAAFAFACAFGGYLLVKAALERVITTNKANNEKAGDNEE